MQLQANVTMLKEGFVAELSDGRQISQSGLKEIACVLSRAGVSAKEVTGEWRPGRRILTAGQQTALKAEMRQLEGATSKVSLAA